MTSENGFKGFSGNTLKIIAAITMFIDHIGVVLFPHTEILRIIGRISFPIFAYMIAEGCHYTRNKLRYFLGIFTLGLGCQTVYSMYDGGKLLGILITFSISIIVVYAMQYMKKTLFLKEAAQKQILSVLLFIATIFGVYVLNEVFIIDYGFFGCMAPAFASAFKIPREVQKPKPQSEEPPENALSKKHILNTEHLLNVLMLGICLVFLMFAMTTLQAYALLALPLLLLYSGKRGKLKMKYFFYVFYPLHLAAIEGISWILKADFFK